MSALPWKQAASNYRSAMRYVAYQLEEEKRWRKADQAEAARTEDKMLDLIHEVETLRTALFDLGAEHNILGGHHDAVKNELTQLRAKYSERCRENERLRAQYQDRCRMYNELSAKYDALSAEYDVLRVAYEGLRSESEEL